MEKLSLEAKTRTVSGKKVKKIRQEKFIPAVIYGHKMKSQILQVPYNKFEKIYGSFGSGSLINLKIDQAESIQVLIQDVQFNPKTDQVQHIDFYKVKKGEKLKTSIKLNFIGESKAVKELGAVLVKNLDEVEVECLPQDLISQIDVDILVLKEFDDLIKIKDLKISEKIEILNDQEDVVASISKPRLEEEAVPAKPQEEIKAEEEKNPSAADEAV